MLPPPGLKVWAVGLNLLDLGDDKLLGAFRKEEEVHCHLFGSQRCMNSANLRYLLEF